MINYIITMAGKGERFKKKGYKIPKWKLSINNKTLLQKSINSLPLNLCSKLFIIYFHEDEKFGLKDLVKAITNKKIIFIKLDVRTKSQIETVMAVQPYLKNTDKVLIFNIDTFFKSDTLEKNLLSNPDGLVGCFKSRNKNYSYAKLEKGFVTKTAEKKVISNLALSGLYYFGEFSYFVESVNYIISKNIHVNNEYYIAPAYNYLIDKGKKIIIDKVNDISIIGVPSDYENYKKNPSKYI